MKKVTPQETLIFLSKLFSSVKSLKHFILSEFFAFFFFGSDEVYGGEEEREPVDGDAVEERDEDEEDEDDGKSFGFWVKF